MLEGAAGAVASSCVEGVVVGVCGVLILVSLWWSIIILGSALDVGLKEMQDRLAARSQARHAADGAGDGEAAHMLAEAAVQDSDGDGAEELGQV